MIEKIEDIEPILEFSYSRSIIRNQADKKDFAKKLYGFRNSSVHGKGGTNLKLMVPKMLKFDDGNAWEIIIEDLAELVIQQFCFSQSE